jgi:hypothetical protein
MTPPIFVMSGAYEDARRSSSDRASKGADHSTQDGGRAKTQTQTAPGHPAVLAAELDAAGWDAQERGDESEYGLKFVQHRHTRYKVVGRLLRRRPP